MKLLNDRNYDEMVWSFLPKFQLEKRVIVVFLTCRLLYFTLGVITRKAVVFMEGHDNNNVCDMITVQL